MLLPHTLIAHHVPKRFRDVGVTGIMLAPLWIILSPVPRIRARDEASVKGKEEAAWAAGG